MTPALRFKRQDGIGGLYSAPPRLVLIANYRRECLARLEDDKRTRRLSESARSLPALARWHQNIDIERFGLPSLAEVQPAMLAIACEHQGLRDDCSSLTGLLYFLASLPAIARADLVPLRERFGIEKLEYVRSTTDPKIGAVEIQGSADPENLKSVGIFGLWMLLAAQPVLGHWERLSPPSPPHLPLDRHRMQAAAVRALAYWKVQIA